MNTKLFFLHRWAVGLFLLMGGLLLTPAEGTYAQLRGTVKVVNESFIKKEKTETPEGCEFTGDPGTFRKSDTLNIDLCVENDKMTVAPGQRKFQIMGNERSTYKCDVAKCTEWKDGHVVEVEKRPGHHWQVKGH